jgi:hypothetical protein
MMPSPLLYNIVSIASEVSYAALFSSIPWPFLIRLAVPLASLIWSFTHSFIYSPTSDRSLTLSSRAHATRARTPHSLIQLHRCAAAAAILGPHTHFELPYHLFFFFFFSCFLFFGSPSLYIAHIIGTSFSSKRHKLVLVGPLLVTIPPVYPLRRPSTHCFPRPPHPSDFFLSSRIEHLLLLPRKLHSRLRRLCSSLFYSSRSPS